MLGYTQDGVAENVHGFGVNPIPVEQNRQLDYAILEVHGDPTSKYGILKISGTAPIPDSPLWVIGHPLGEAQRISREKCKSGRPAVSEGRLRHTCDTLPGNSGSPVIDPETRRVVGLHHAGSRRNSINFAIPFARIARSSEIIKKIVQKSSAKTGSDPDALTAALTNQPDNVRNALKGESELPFDGQWHVTFEGSGCGKSFGHFSIAVLKGRIDERRLKGRVSPQGIVNIQGYRQDGRKGKVFKGRIDGTAGSGDFQGRKARCRGTFKIARKAGSAVGKGVTGVRQTPAGTPATLILEPQVSLAKVGCYSGPIDGRWSRKSQAALSLFNRFADLKLETASPSELAKNVVQSYGQKVCPAGKGPIGRKASKARNAKTRKCRRETANECIARTSGRRGTGVCRRPNRRIVCK